MRARVILVAVLVVTVALVGCTQAAPAQKPAEVQVGGAEVSLSPARIFNEGQKTLLFTVEASGKIYQGSTQQGQAVLTFEGGKIYRGASSAGELLFTLDGSKLKVGANGPTAYTFESGFKVREGDNGAVVYTISNNRMFAGSGTSGAIVFDANTSLENDIQYVLPVLADQRF